MAARTDILLFRIINNTSVVTFRGSSSMVDYASTKGAIVGFTRSLALQLIPKGIRVNAVAYVYS